MTVCGGAIAAAGDLHFAMSPISNQPYVYIAAAAILGVFLGYLLWMAPPSRQRSSAALLTANAMLWLAGELAVRVSPNEHVALISIRLTYGVIGLIPLTVDRLVSSLSDPTATRWRPGVAPLALALGTLILLPTPLLIAGATRDPSGFHRVSGPLFTAFALLLFGGLLSDVRLAVRGARFATNPLHRVRCQYLLVGFVTAVILGFVDLGVLQPLGIRSHRMFIAPLEVTFAMATVIYPMIHSRLLDVPTALRRSLIFAALLATLLIPCLGLSLLAEQLMTGTISLGPSIVTAALFGIAGFVFPRLRVSAEETLEQALFGARADERRLLLASSREVTSVLDLSTLASVTGTTLKRAFATDAILWLRQGEKLVALNRLDCDLSAEQAAEVLGWAESANEPLVLSEVSSGISRGMAELRDRGVELAFALRVKDRTVGMLTVAGRGDGAMYTDDDLALVVTLANQVAIALENARLYEELRESREQVNRASRLSSVGMLAAGIAHEIRNPLVAVRTFLELFPQRKNDEEFCTTFQQLSLKEVDRITRLITELLTFARTHERTLAPVDVGEVVQHVAALLQPEAGKRTVNLMLSCGRDVPAVEGDASQLQQVILNLVLNAIEASPAGGTVTILVQSGRTLRGEPHVRIEVADEGPGVLREHREAIFTPFFTTKDTGTGLGLAVAHQLVVEHGGTLSVTSPPSGGSTFAVTLPTAAAASRATSERQLRVVNG